VGWQGQDAAFLSSIITGIVFVVTTVVAVLTVDKFGRRVSHLRHCHACRLRDASSIAALHARLAPARLLTSRSCAGPQVLFIQGGVQMLLAEVLLPL
jgi:hypothetical protein